MGVGFSGKINVDGVFKGYGIANEPGLFDDALLWYDFSDSSTVTLVDTDKVSSVSNKGTHGGSIAPDGGQTDRFTYTTSAAMNNLNVVDLNSTVLVSLVQVDNNLLPITGKDMTYFYVMNRTQARTVMQFAMGKSKASFVAAAADQVWEDYIQTFSGRDLTFIINRGTDGTSQAADSMGSYQAGVDLIGVRFDSVGNSLKYFRHLDDNEYSYTITQNFNSNCYYQIFGDWVWSTNTSTGEYQMGEFAMYDSYLDNTTFDAKVADLKTKWGIT